MSSETSKRAKYIPRSLHSSPFSSSRFSPSRIGRNVKKSQTASFQLPSNLLSTPETCLWQASFRIRRRFGRTLPAPAFSSIHPINVIQLQGYSIIRRVL